MTATPAVPRHHPVTRRVHVRYEWDEMGVSTLRGIAWRAVCDCDWRGPTRRTRNDARIDLGLHLDDMRDA